MTTHKKAGRPKKPASKKRRQIRVYVDPETETAIKAGIGLKRLGKWLDKNHDRVK